MPVLSQRLLGPILVPNNDTLVFTVPAGRTLVVRTMVYWNHSGGTLTFNMKMDPAAGGQVLIRKAIASQEPVVWADRYYFNPGDHLRIYDGGNGTNLFTMFGALLLGSPV